MADIQDVLDAIVGVIGTAFYPPGSTDFQSACGVPVVIYPGWPSQTNLDEDLRQGKTHITVFPRQEEKNTTRYPSDEVVTRDPAPTMTVAVNGQDVILGGVVLAPQNVALLVGSKAYVYTVQTGDTLLTVAAAVAALAAVDFPGTVADQWVVRLPRYAVIKAARIGAFGTVTQEVRRQERRVQITVWSNSPDNRKAVCKLLDATLAPLRFVTLVDGFSARITYASSAYVDQNQKALLYRRDYIYAVEFATTVSTEAAAVVVEQLNITGGNDPSGVAAVATIYS